MIRIALISDNSKDQPSFRRLYHTLNHTSDLSPHCYLRKPQQAWEEQIGQSASMLRLACRYAMNKIMGLNTEESMSHPIGAPELEMQQIEHSDIVHLHNIKNITLSTRSLAEIPKATVYEIRDMHPLTALCGSSYNCTQLEKACPNCPESKFKQFAQNLARKKEAALRNIHKLVFVTSSQWMGEIAHKSPLLSGRQWRQIPISIDSNDLIPHDRCNCKIALGIHPHNRVIAYPGTKLGINSPKGYLHEVLEILAQQCSEPITLLLLGHQEPKNLPYASVHLPASENKENERAKIYSAADILLLPAQTGEGEMIALEAMSCGLPLVSFKTGALPEIIEEGENGRLIPENEPYAAAQRLKELLEAPILRFHYGLNARKYVLENHNQYIIGELYKQLYREMLQEG